MRFATAVNMFSLTGQKLNFVILNLPATSLDVGHSVGLLLITDGIEED